ncbi:MAG: alpha/beta fold hydrolase [Deltaproteobacteria bacterium]|nr:alpha/beta fold hydrolase [Deltaproteobacteria bacterium]
MQKLFLYGVILCVLPAVTLNSIALAQGTIPDTLFDSGESDLQSIALMTLEGGAQNRRVEAVIEQDSASGFPVILVHGWCGSPESFGMLGQFLLEDLQLAKVGNFTYTGSASGIPEPVRSNLKRLAGQLARYINDQIADLGVSQVDVVAHSMGGLLARAWMAGLTSVPYSNQIRRLVIAGTPNLGVGKTGTPPGCSEDNAAVVAAQNRQMLYGSLFLKRLNKQWQKKVGKTISPPDILTIVGCGLAQPGAACLSDAVVDEASATLPVESPDYLVRYVNRIHAAFLGVSSISLVDIENRGHETYQLVKQFLETGTADSFYDPLLIRGIVVAPLVEDSQPPPPFTQTQGVDFGKFSPQMRSRGFPHCTDLSQTSPFIKHKPSDDITGWWTLTDVLPGCWQVRVNSKKYRSAESLVNVTVGRPTLMSPVVVIEK